MSRYRTLFSLTVEHDYFREAVCRAMRVELVTEPPALFRNRLLLLKRMAENRWDVLGDVDGGGVEEGSDRVIFRFYLTDPYFMYYTEWEGYGINERYLLAEWGAEEVDAANRLVPLTGGELLKRLPLPAELFCVALPLSERMFTKALQGEHERLKLRFSAKKMFWEYLFIQHRRERPEGELVFEEADARLEFSKPVPVKSSLTEMPVWMSRSKVAVGMKEYYDYQLDLSEVYRVNRNIRQKIVRDVEYPQPGVFHDVEEGVLRQVVYFG